MLGQILARDRLLSGRRRRLLAGASTAVLALAALAPHPAMAGNYVASDDTSLRLAIQAANADPDPSATITLTKNFEVFSTALPTPTKPLTIDTQGFTLGGTNNPSGAGNPINISGAGATTTFIGVFAGGNASPAVNAVGGTGLIMSSGALAINNGSITGGIGGGAGGADGNGTQLNAASTLINNGTITGGSGGAGGVGGLGTLLQNTSSLVNNGTITGGTGITAGGVGATVTAGSSLTNNGTIQGGNSQSGSGAAGVNFRSPTGVNVLVNNANGIIRGGNGVTAGGIGVRVLAGTGQIINAGLIAGGNAAAAIGTNSSSISIDLINSGIIRAGAGELNAISLFNGGATGPGTITLELRAGSAIEGNVVGSAAALTDTLRLGGIADDTFDVSAIGPQYQNFDIFQKTGSSTWTLTGAGTATTNWDIQQGTLQLGAGGTSGSIIGNVTNNGTFAFNRSDALTYSGVISGTGTVRQIGTGVTTLTGTNTYSGGTFLNAGTLSVAGEANLGDIAGALNFDGGALQVTGTGFTSTARTINWGAGGGGFDIADPANVFTVGQVLASGGALTKLGAGTLVLTGANGYTGGTAIDGGTLQVSSDGNLGARSGDLTFNGGTLQNTAAFASARNIVLGDDGGTFLTDANLALSGNITGDGLLNKDGAGTLTLSGNNSYTAGTRILAGTLEAEGGSAIGDESSVFVLGGTLRILDDETVATLSSGLGMSGVVDLAGGDLKTSANFANVTASFYGNITGAGGFIKDGAYGQVLAGDSTYAGATQILDGTLYAVGAGRNSISDVSAVTIADGATLSLVQPFPAFAGEESDDETIGSLSGAGNVNLGDKTLTLGGDNSSTTFSGAISGGGSLAKAGTGTFTLTGANTYSGATTVDSGKLIVEGSLGNTQTTVNSGGTLGGSGSIGGAVIIADGGVLAPGSSPGTLTVGSLSLSSGSTLDYQLGQAGIVGGGVNDLTVVTGDLTLDGSLNVTDVGGFGPGVYRLINYGGTLTDNGLEFGNLPAGVTTADLTVQTSVANQVNLISTVGADLLFWDGDAAGNANNNLVDGGNGTWTATSPNWTTSTGLVNGAMKPQPGFAIFQTLGGTVIADDGAGALEVTGMQFAADGYRIEGDAITLAGTGGESIIRVGDGTSAGAGYTATIASVLTGASSLTKTDAGTLVLSGANTYTGGTTVSGGVLSVSADNNLGDAAGGLTLSGGTLRNTAVFSSARDVTLSAAGGTFDTMADLTLSGALSGAGNFIKDGQGTLVLASDSSAFTGTTLVSGGTLAAGAANAFSPSSQFSVASGATLDLAGTSQTVAGLTNAGTVRIAGGGLGNTLTISGDYVGNGGNIVLNTALGGDGSATDMLVIAGGTSGTGTLEVANFGGAGDQTVEGIKIVDVGGVSNGTFSLKSDYTFEGDAAVVGGAYAYRLYEGGVSTPADGDWYLRSELDNSLLYQAGAPLYEAYAGVLQSFNQLGTLQQRLGNRSWTVEAQGADGISDDVKAEAGIGLWGRIEGTSGSYDPQSSTTGTTYDTSTWRLQTGADMLVSDSAAGQLIGGVAFQYGTVSADVSSVFGSGSIDTTGYGVSGSLTWYGAEGFYLDGQVQVVWYDSNLDSATAGQRLVDRNNGVGYALGVEAGKRIMLDPSWSLTPQAQLAWSSVDFDAFTDSFGASVAPGNSDSLLGRLGLSLDRQTQWQDRTGRAGHTNLYGIANLYYDFRDGSSVDLAGSTLSSRNEQLWGGLGIGGTINWADDKFSVFGEAVARTGLEDVGDSHVLTGSLGFRAKW
jgi:fibronectin-binding autotransporter adhesin